MSEHSILFAKPKAVKPSDKKVLREAGIIVVEVDDPHAVKLVRAAYELSHGDLLACAGHAILQSSSAYSSFGVQVAKLLAKTKGPE